MIPRIQAEKIIDMNSVLVKQAGFDILIDKLDQPGNKVILASKK